MTRFLLGRTLVVSSDPEFLEQGRRVLLRLGAGTVNVLPDGSELVARLRALPPFSLILHNPDKASQTRASLPRLLRAADVIANLGRPNPEPPRLILVADEADPAELGELLVLGYQDVLLKPLNDALFETRISDFCTRTRLTPRRLMLAAEPLPDLIRKPTPAHHDTLKRRSAALTPEAAIASLLVPGKESSTGEGSRQAEPSVGNASFDFETNQANQTDQGGGGQTGGPAGGQVRQDAEWAPVNAVPNRAGAEAIEGAQNGDRMPDATHAQGGQTEPAEDAPPAPADPHQEEMMRRFKFIMFEVDEYE